MHPGVATVDGGVKAAVVHFHRGGPLVALVGNPNCGKTALFNLLTGSRQKVANYGGVTVERKEGRLDLGAGRHLRVLDLPGAYSLHPRSPDERVTHDVLYGTASGERRPDLVACVVDATNLRRNLRLVLAVKRLGIPCVVALNMTDLAEKRGLVIDTDQLAHELGMPVVRTVAVKRGGDTALRDFLARYWAAPRRELDPAQRLAEPASTEADHEAVQRILQRLELDAILPHTASDRLDRIVLHPVIGPLLLAAVMFFMFQAVFAWAEAPKAAIEAATAGVGNAAGAVLGEGPLRSLLVDGVIAGVGTVVSFLPQILILFLFILVLEESGYLPRAAFLLDRLMGGAGLSGRSFIPLLSCFACAIPGIMAARTIADPRDRLLTIMIAPMMTCSARLPVYTLLIGAFIPRREVAGFLELQGLVLFGLYLVGALGALGVAWIMKRFTKIGRMVRPLMMEMPSYHWPAPRNLALGLWQRAAVFMKRVSGIILGLTVLLWFLSSFPAPPAGAPGAPIEYSFAGMIGHALAPLVEAVGFNWQIAIALVPGMAAREVTVSALGTVYALSGGGKEAASALAPIIAQGWSLATALALLAWFVFAPQCIATIATVRRETGGWKMPAVMVGYLFALAWLAAFGTYHTARWLGAA